MGKDDDFSHKTDQQMKNDLLTLLHSCQASNSWISSDFMPGKMPADEAFILKGI